MAAAKFALRGNSLNAYLHSGSGKTPLVIDTSGGGAPAVVADAGAIGGFAIDYNGGGVTKGHIFPGFDNSQKTGLISVLNRCAPAYSGSPAGNQSYISIGGPRLLNGTAIQLVQLDHLTTGNLVITVTDVTGGGTVNSILGAWSPVSGTYYDIVITWNGQSGANLFKVYIDGVLFAQYNTGRTWTTALNYQSTILVGAGQNQVQQGLYKLNEYVLFDYVIDPTNTGLNLNGAARASFVDLSAYVLDPTASTDPGIANVRLSTGYQIAGVAKTGTAAIPTAANVRSGTATGATTGTLAVPAASNVRAGTAVDAGTGTAAIPTAANVRAGTATDATTGTLAVPLASNVRLGTAVDAGTGTAAIPTASQVLNGVAVDATTGNVVLPPQADVVSGEVYGPSNSLTGTAAMPAPGNVLLGVAVDATVGTLVVPTASQILEGVAFGPAGASTGTLIRNSLVAATVIGQNPPSATATLLEFTQGDDMVLNLLALNGPDGDPFDLSAATFSTEMVGESGLVTFGNAQHTADPDQTANKGKFTLSLSDTDTESLKIAKKKGLVTKVTQGSNSIYFHGTEIFTLIEKDPKK